MTSQHHNHNPNQNQIFGQDPELDFFMYYDPKTYVPKPFFFYQPDPSIKGALFNFSPANLVYGDAPKSHGHGGSCLTTMYRMDNVACPIPTGTGPAMADPSSTAPMGQIVPLKFQTPVMQCLFGLCKNERGNRDVFKLKLGFGGANNKQELADFFHTCAAFDASNTDVLLKHKASWFSDADIMSDDEVRRTYSAISRLGRSKATKKSYPPHLALTLTRQAGKFKTRTFDHEGKCVELTEALIRPGTKLRAIFEYRGMWFANGKESPSCHAIQLQVLQPDIPVNFSFA